jgi:hypothetical protein
MNVWPLKMGGEERGAAEAALEVRDGPTVPDAVSEVAAAAFAVSAADARLGDRRHARARWGDAAIGTLPVVVDELSPAP